MTKKRRDERWAVCQVELEFPITDKGLADYDRLDDLVYGFIPEAKGAVLHVYVMTKGLPRSTWGRANS